MRQNTELLPVLLSWFLSFWGKIYTNFRFCFRLCDFDSSLHGAVELVLLPWRKTMSHLTYFLKQAVRVATQSHTICPRPSPPPWASHDRIASLAYKYVKALVLPTVYTVALPQHSLANKTVQLRPKSTTGSSFLLEYIRYFCWRYDPSPRKTFFISRFCVSCLCPFLLNINLFLLYK